MTKTLRTQVGIIGSGPSGLLLGQLLSNAGIDTVIVDRQSREHIEGRIRAGVLEWGSVETLREAGVGARMDREGLVHSGFDLAFQGERHRIDLHGLTGKDVLVYGQTEITKDMIDQRLSEGREIMFEASDVQPLDVDSDNPSISFTHQGDEVVLECDYIAGCDGFHGVSRTAIPADILKTYQMDYPFGWLGILTEQPPVSEELIYANHERGFALCSMRSPTRSRYYIQCDVADDVNAWSDAAFWEEFERRIGADTAANLSRGDSFEKSIAPLRSFVAEPMRHGRLFLAGDASHIVPPTGAKGLNLAISDVRVLAQALIEKIKNNQDTLLDGYSGLCLDRIWKAERFSWYLTRLTHRFPDANPFEQRMQEAEFKYIRESEHASRVIAENYVGLPLQL